MMKRNCILMALTFLTTGNIWAEEIPKDTIKVVDVEEILIIASPKDSQHSLVTTGHAGKPSD